MLMTLPWREWFKRNNPDAYQSVAGRMLEAVRHDYWTPSEEVIKSLATEYEQSVAENGASCCHHTCGNPLLHEFVSGDGICGLATLSR